MSPWQAALIPLVIIAVLGSIAFFVGYRGIFSNERAYEVEALPTARPKPASSAQETKALISEDSAARRHELRAKVAVSNRLTSRAPHEQAILV